MIPLAASQMGEPLVIGAVACAALSAAIVLWFLGARPSLSLETKVLLFFGIALFPICAAMATNVVGFQASTTRPFCGSCHLMTPYTEDAANPASDSLASRHSRNALFGGSSCYKCHENYEMFGTVLTKLDGMHHVWVYYAEGARKIPLRESIGTIHLYEPFTNRVCRECHSGVTKGFDAVPDHRSAREELESGATSCAGAGCHGPAHPFSKKQGAERAEGEALK